MNTFDPKKRSTFSFSFEEWKKNYNETPLKESVESEDEKTINFKDGINKYLKGAKLDGIVTVPDTFEDLEYKYLHPSGSNGYKSCLIFDTDGVYVKTIEGYRRL